MKKATFSFAVAIAAVGLIMAGEAASAGGDPPAAQGKAAKRASQAGPSKSGKADAKQARQAASAPVSINTLSAAPQTAAPSAAMGGMARQINQNISSYVSTDALNAGPQAVPAPGPAMGGMAQQINQQVSSYVSMEGAVAAPASQQAASGSPVPQLNLQDMITQAIQSMPQQQRGQLAAEMAGQNLALLQQGNSIASQLREKVREQIMADRYANISQLAPTKFRSTVQPMMVQQMIGNIRPWEFPGRFKSTLMPGVVGQISGGKGAGFPSIPGVPAEVISQVGGQVTQQQKQLMQESVGSGALKNTPRQ